MSRFGGLEMLDRKIKLLSEEWRALVFLMDIAQKATGKRPSLSKAIGDAIRVNAAQEGFKNEDEYQQKQ